MTLNYNNEGSYHLADIMRGWLKDTLSDFHVEKDNNSKLLLQIQIDGYNWLVLNVLISQATLTPKLDIFVERKFDNKNFYRHTYQILGDGIKDSWDEEINHAYDSGFLNKLKNEIEKVKLGAWVDPSCDRVNDNYL